ncbi:MAG: hypothetical protein ACOC0Z_08340 [Halohasta sp.]
MLSSVATPFFVSVLVGQPMLVVIYLITIAVSLWLFRDALRRDKSVVVAGGWAVGGLVFPAIVHFAYLYLRLKTDGGVADPSVGGPD